MQEDQKENGGKGMAPEKALSDHPVEIETLGSGGPPQPSMGDIPPDYPGLLAAFRRLQEESRQHTEALATAAHEIKTPLAIIAGYIELLLTQKLGPLNDRQVQILEESYTSCTRLRQFVTDFLTFSAHSSGKVEMKFAVGGLNDCLSELYGYWLPLLQKRGVAFYFLASDKLKPFRFDYHKVQHAVSNLVENSLKFTPPGGTVWLSTEPYVWERRVHSEFGGTNERRSQTQEPNAVRVCVSDTGRGIAPEYHRDIFDDFFKVPEGENVTEGMGLGLAIARRLIQAHGGAIWVESERGSGSKFLFILPLRTV